MELDQKTSPMMAQWHACKASTPDSLLFFRLGDFYEAFYEDAVILAKELDLTLTKRQEIPMAGVPFHSAESYIDKLVEKGYRVAIAEQMEDPRSVKGIVKREVVRIVTPGTVITSTLLSDKSNNYLACITQVGEIHGLCILDLTTAEFRAMEFEDVKQILDALCRLNPSELLLQEKWKKHNEALLEEMRSQLNFALTVKDDWHFDHHHACDVLLRHFHVHNLDGFGLKGMIAAINASGAILNYVREDLNLSIDHIRTLSTEHVGTYMLLDRSTQRHLELTESLHEKKKSHSLLQLIDKTNTPMGGRLLKKWLTQPLLSPEAIQKRQDGIAELLLEWQSSMEIGQQLDEIRDLERMIMRIETGYASPRDIAGLRFSLERIPHISKKLTSFSSPILVDARAQLDTPDYAIATLVSKIRSAIVDAPPLRISDTGIFRTGYHAELDALHAIKSDNHAWIAAYQAQLKESTHIKTLKVGYTKAFGFYIEVSRGQSDRIPDTFQRRQTLINAERFITPELKEYEHKMLHAEERISALEAELFTTLRQEIALQAPAIRSIAQAIAQIDCLHALAVIAKKWDWVRPVVDGGDLLYIEQGRHPVIEATLQRETFVPNDVLLDAQKQRLYLITGPNMAGKSTFIRQVAILVILSQMGSFIPAKSAHLGIVDKVFSRIGASDDLSRGQSTFMVEMTETANILNNATDRSLVILDEIGRGTSTYDGISIAWSVAEYLLTQPGKKAKTLFATHYWELTEMEKLTPGAVNYNVAVHESDKGIIFLHKIVKGGTDKSYGIHVAKLAGLPSAAIKRAQEMLAKLERSSGRIAEPLPPKQSQQLSLFSLKREETAFDKVAEELKNLDPNHLTPLEALKKIAEWNTKIAIH